MEEIPAKPLNYTCLESEMDIAYYLIKQGRIDEAWPHLNKVADLFVYKQNMSRLGTLEIAKEKYVSNS